MEIDWGEHFKYEDGRLYWKHGSKNGACQPGKEAGYLCRFHERWVIGLSGKAYKRARIVWEMHRGRIPNGLVVDHINRVRQDDRIENLRLVSTVVNNRNKSLDVRNKSGVTGVRQDLARNKWVAYINRDGKQVRLGRFNTKEEAIAARQWAAITEGYLGA